MANCESLNDMNLDKGTFCFNGEIDGFALFADTISVADASLKTQAWWDAQIYDSTNRVVALVGTDDSEITPAEIQEYSPKRGFKVQTSKGSNEYMLKFKDTECLRKTLDPLNGQEAHALFFTTSDYIQGLPGSTNLITKAVKTSINISKELVDGVSLIVVKFTFAVDFEMLFIELQMDDGFTTSELSGLTGIYLDGVSASVVSDITVLAYDCSRTALEDLVVANFLVYNVTDDPTKATPIVPSGVVGTGNSYVITIAAQDSGDNLWVGAAVPVVGSLFVTGEPAVIAIP